MIVGLFTKDIPFFRTPKNVHANPLLKALGAAREESLLMAALWVSVFALSMREDANTLDLVLWITVLLIQSIPYFASVLLSFVSIFPKYKLNMGHGISE